MPKHKLYGTLKHKLKHHSWHCFSLATFVNFPEWKAKPSLHYFLCQSVKGKTTYDDLNKSKTMNLCHNEKHSLL